MEAGVIVASHGPVTLGGEHLERAPMDEHEHDTHGDTEIEAGGYIDDDDPPEIEAMASDSEDAAALLVDDPPEAWPPAPTGPERMTAGTSGDRPRRRPRGAARRLIERRREAEWLRDQLSDWDID